MLGELVVNGVAIISIRGDGIVRVD